jgi:G:T-mismatch repair DNA endonuclease (very short patch repair protein)
MRCEHVACLAKAQAMANRSLPDDSAEHADLRAALDEAGARWRRRRDLARAALFCLWSAACIAFGAACCWYSVKP